MFDNYNYPLGADNESAPWNQEENPEREFEVTVYQTLSKTAKVKTTKYNLEVVQEYDDMGGFKEENIDTLDTDWKEVYNDCSYTPLELIGILKRILQNPASLKLYNKKHLIEDCEGWIEDDFEVIEE